MTFMETPWNASDVIKHVAAISFQGKGAAKILYGKETIIKIPIFYDQAKTIWFFFLDSVFNDVWVVLL